MSRERDRGPGKRLDMKKRIVTINGEEFELFKADAGASVNFHGTGAAYDEIESVYGRPSKTKVGIWHSWCDWCYELNENGNPCELWIASHTCMTFSIGGKVQYDGHVYELWITKCHNRAYLVA